MGGGGVCKMRANACKGGGGVLALSMHAFWPLKRLQFLVVLMEGNLKPVTSIEQFSHSFCHCYSESYPVHKLKNFCPVVGFTKQPIGGPGQVGVEFFISSSQIA